MEILSKLYIEPTNRCNLDCRTCIRNTWQEPMGEMSEATFDEILLGLKEFSPRPRVFFGGFGEPLLHPDIIDMIARVKALGSQVELVTNGTMLTSEMSRKLIRSGIKTLWISIDGARPESYADIRLGAALPQILDNLKMFQVLLYEEVEEACCDYSVGSLVELGIVFVAMKRNIADLPEVIRIGRQFEASRFLVTNLLPYTEEMRDEVLYRRVMDTYGTIYLPPIDRNEITGKPLSRIMDSGLKISLNQYDPGIVRGRCPFIDSGAAAIGWDGGFSPCLPLMHNHKSYYFDRSRFSRRWVIGNLSDRSLSALWSNRSHLAFREKVQTFDFSPCTSCYSCHLFDTNEEDCSGNEFPTCGGCLWSQGLIQCP